KSVYEDTTASQEAVNSATEALKAATETFNQKKNSVDKTKLFEAIEAAKENITKIKKAGKTDIEKYQSAIDAAIAVYNKADATQSEIDNALTELFLATKTFNSKNNPSSSGGGSSSSTKYYDVKVTTNDGGSASVSQNRVPSGNSVTITVVPEDGYEIESITVNGEYFGNAEKSTIAKITQNTDIVVTFAPKWTNPFIDVTDSDWFYDNVIWVNKNGLMNGITENTFGPQANVTRAMMVTILYRAEGEPEVNKSVPFADVDANAYYADAVVWAQQNGIVYGVTENEFAPDDNITREQIAAIMFRYAKYKGYDVSVGENTNILSYTDAESVSEYAIASIQYAVGAGLMKGKSNTTLNPQDNATRAEIAAILQRFLEANK
ncbi:MAG: S-layer homology domain-containing protein, partial [Clostridia bacterium]